MEEKGLVAKQKSEDLSERWQKQIRVAEEMLKSGLLPKEVNTPQKVILIMETGREIGVPPVEALRNIYVVNNRTALNSQLMLSLLHRSEKLEDIQIKDNANSCTVTMKRKGMSPYTVTFNEADAKRAGLIWKDNWKKYPANMYRARAVSMCARVVAPDVIGGLYTLEEIQAGLDTERAITQVEETAQITGTQEGYDQWLNQFYADFEHDLGLMEEPYDIKRWESSHKKELGMLLDNDRQKVQERFTEKFGQLVKDAPAVKGERGPIEEKITLASLKELASQCKTADELTNWFKSIQGEAGKQLTNEEFLGLVDECKAIKAVLQGEKIPKQNGRMPAPETTQEMFEGLGEKEMKKEKPKRSPKVEQFLAYLGEVPKRDEFNHRLAEVKKGKAFKSLTKEELEQLEIGVADIMAMFPRS